VNTKPSGPPSGPPGTRRPAGLLARANAFLVSPKLAIALLVIVLACCVVGVTVVRGVRAGQLIFATLWFNALLVLLAVSSFAAFFSRAWKRKLTLVSAGMILFHLSFAAMLGGIVYNRLFFFRGAIRLTEGETLASDVPESYDSVEHGRFFDFRRLRGATTLVAMHRDYKVNGGNKRAAYEIAVGDASPRRRSIIYVTEYLDHDGLRYFCSKEGYSVLLIVSEKGGREIFGAHVPLQSFQQKDGSYQYASGTSTGEIAFAFPPPPDQALLAVLLRFRPSTVEDRKGEITFRTWAPGTMGLGPSEGRGGASPDPHAASPGAASPDPFGAHWDPLGGQANPHEAPSPPPMFLSESRPAHGPDQHDARGAPADPHGPRKDAGPAFPPPEHEGRLVVGAPFDAGKYTLTAREIRYWVGMDVRYDPGLTVILASLCFGLGGMAVTFVGRIRQGAARRRKVEAAGPAPSPAPAREENA
jgi:hypothetical protein